MQCPSYRLPVSGLGRFVELLRGHKISLRVRLPDWPGEFECRIRRGLSSVDTHGYRIGDELRFDLTFSEPLHGIVRESIFACGGSACDADTMLAGWNAITPPAEPNPNDRNA
jgi:hypothetical protein